MSYTVVADQNIPFVKTAFKELGDVITLPGYAISPRHLQSAQVLLVRSVTEVDAALLDGSDIKFVGSATAGTNHVDTDYLRRMNIGFAHAPGANAESVVEYVLAALHRLAIRQSATLDSLTAGVVGCGQVGGRLAQRLNALGCNVLCNDPPLEHAAQAGGSAASTHPFSSLSATLEQADVISLHVPLTSTGRWPTRHLIGEKELTSMKDSAWLLNASRGGVVDEAALQRALERDAIGAAVIDTWEDEPTPSPDLIRQAEIATPHIAGYSFDGKVRGTAMLHAAVTSHFGVDPQWSADEVLAADSKPALSLPEGGNSTEQADALIRQMYAIEEDDRRMRGLLDVPQEERADYFRGLRKNYPKRRSFRRFALPDDAPADLKWHFSALQGHQDEPEAAAEESAATPSNGA